MPTTFHGAAQADFTFGVASAGFATSDDAASTFAITFGPVTAGYNNAIVTTASTTRIRFGAFTDGTAFSIRPIAPTTLAVSAAPDESLTLTPA